MSIIKGKNIYLERFDEDHLNSNEYYKWLCDYDVMKYIGRHDYLLGVTFDSVKKYVNDVWNSPYATLYAICTTDGKFIGTLKLNYHNQFNYMNRVIEIGLMLGNKKDWGKGYGTQAVKIASNHAFNVLSVHKIVAGIYENNFGIYKVFEKSGYKLEGRHRNELMHEGNYYDHLYLGCFKNELIQ